VSRTRRPTRRSHTAPPPPPPPPPRGSPVRASNAGTRNTSSATTLPGAGVATASSLSGAGVTPSSAASSSSTSSHLA